MMAIVCWLYERPWDVQAFAAITATILFLILAEISNLYRSYRSELISREMTIVCIVWFGVVFLLLILSYTFKSSEQFSRLAIITWMLITPLSLCSWRLLIRFMLRRLRNNGRNQRIAAIAGAGENGVQVAQIIDQSPWMGLKSIGFFDDRTPQPDRTTWAGPIKGNFNALIEKAKNRSIDVIYIALPLSSAHRIDALLKQLSDCTTSVYVVPEAFWTEVMRGRWVNLGTLPTVSVFETPFYDLNGWLKRLEDIIFALVILLFAFIPMLGIAILVWLTSEGPVLYKQKRYGLDGREIEVWKFRTMKVQPAGTEIVQAKRGDKRFTPVGAFLRKTSLDEFPQFINVLQGSMSIVGPRPHAVVHNERYRTLINGYMLRHKVPPGITGWAQVNGWRGETETVKKMEERVKHDLWYIHNWSIWLDIKIILLTAVKGFINKNAY
jgi:putative colanic acid biosynthesis UDP-glucose lipid carrier transferase